MKERRREKKEKRESGSRDCEWQVWPGPPFNEPPSSPLGQQAWPGRVSEKPPRNYALTEDLEETTVGCHNFDESSSPSSVPDNFGVQHVRSLLFTRTLK